MNTKTKFLCVVTAFALSYGFAQQEQQPIEALEEVVITDSKFKLKRENSGKVITKITKEELVRLQGKSVAEIVNTVSGIEINGARSNAGQNLSYFVRGGRNRQVLILIDGIAVSDPSQIANDYDLRLLSADQVESIEILKGAASTLYGTGAATAVINIKLKEASKKQIAANFKTLMGSNQSQSDTNYAIENFLNSVSLNGTLSKFNYLASFGHQYTNGLSAVSNGTESDAFQSINGNLKLGYQFSEKVTVNAYASFDKFDAAFDDFDYTDADNLSETNQYRLGVSSEIKYTKGSVSINASYNNVERDIESSFPSQFNAESYFIDAFNRYKFNNQFYTIIGINYQENDMESFSIPFGATDFQQSINPENASFNVVDPYVNAVYVSDFGLNLNTGLRLNNHSNYGSHLVYNVNPSFKKDTGFGYLKVLSSYSTAFIAPSLFQLYEPSYGNTDLQPEENRTIEAGIEAEIGKKTRISAVYFNREETNFIDFTLVDPDNFIFQYTNVDDAFTASGVEVEVFIPVDDKLNFNVNGTYTKVEEDLNLRIPEFRANARLDYQFCDKVFMSLAYQYNADREDAYFDNTTFETINVNLPSYGLLDFYISQKVLKDKVTLFANLTNILNEDYQELFGYTTKGRNLNIGLNLKF